MNRNLCIAAFAAGLLTVCWVGIGYINSNPLALIMTLVIGAIYLMGALEMRRFSEATTTLTAALANIPENLARLGDWLDQLHPSLQNAVRLRVEGERVGMPGPALTPYLTGLLVMLGMLGTFLGMVVTLNGAVLALQGSTDLETMRASLSAPIKGLGLAFGTSVAGVASSAMLGLISSLCRRERVQAAQLLDAKISTDLHVFSLAHERKETFKALHFQTKALPEVVDKLEAMMASMERQNQQLHERLVSNQEGLHRDTKAIYTDLASSVDASLKTSLTESARAAAEVIAQLRHEISNSMARDNSLLEERSQIMATLSSLLDAINQGAVEQRAAIDSLVTSSTEMLDRAGSSFAAKIEAEATKVADSATQVSGSAIEVSSLSDAFGFAVQQFSDANEKMIASLQRIEASLDQTMARSDEQLAYYVAQAREIIDLSIMSQKQIVDEMQQLAGKQSPRAAGAA